MNSASYSPGARASADAAAAGAAATDVALVSPDVSAAPDGAAPEPPHPASATTLAKAAAVISPAKNRFNPITPSCFFRPFDRSGHPTRTAIGQKKKPSSRDEGFGLQTAPYRAVLFVQPIPCGPRYLSQHDNRQVSRLIGSDVRPFGPSSPTHPPPSQFPSDIWRTLPNHGDKIVRDSHPLPFSPRSSARLRCAARSPIVLFSCNE